LTRGRENGFAQRAENERLFFLWPWYDACVELITTFYDGRFIQDAFVDPNNDVRREKLKEAILAYLRITPLAADTAEGVIACWLPKLDFKAAPLLVEDVLGELVKEGLLVARALSDGRTLYSVALNARKNFTPSR